MRFEFDEKGMSVRKLANINMFSLITEVLRIISPSI